MPDPIALHSKWIKPQGNFTAWLVCLSAGLFFLYEFFQLNLFDVINESLLVDFNLNSTQLSWLSSSYLWANILFLLPAGILLDRYSVRRIILIAMSICILGTVGFAFSTAYAWAFICHFLTGIGNGFCFLACVVLVSRWFPPQRQAFVIGCIVTMAFLGGMLAHTPLAYLKTHYGWRDALLIDAAFGMVILFWMFIVLQDTPLTVLKKEPNANPGRIHLKAIVLNRQNIMAGIYTACLNLPIMVLCALWGASYLRTVHHLSVLSASNVVSLLFIGSIIGCPFVGWLSDRKGQRKPMMTAGAIATLMTLVPLFLNRPLSPMVLSILFFSLGFFTSTQVISYPLIAESNSKQNTGVATGIASMIIMGGGALGQIMFGFLLKIHEGHHALEARDFQFAMGLFPCMVLVALAAMKCIRETNCRHVDE
jgi:MFS family permease